MITPAQVSESINVPSSTIRRWAARFENNLSPRKGKKRMYTITDLDTFRKIRDLSAAGHGLDNIAQMLNVIEKPSEETAILSLTDFVQSLELAHSTMSQLQDRINSQDDRIKQLEDWIVTPFYKRIGKKPPIK